MNSPNFGSILDQQSSEIQKPKPLPVGTYICVVQGLPKMDKTSKKQTEYVEFTLGILGAGEDVDTEALEEAGGFQGKTVRDTYYLTETAIWRLKKFLDDCGIDEDDMSLRQRIDQAPGCQVAVTIKHQASEDGTSVYANVAGTAAVE